MKKLLIVSPHFPPVNAPDLQRVRMSLPYYEQHGWEPVVLTVEDRFQHASREPELAATVPPHVRVVRTGAIPPKTARLFGVGNIGLRAGLPLFARGLELLNDESFDLVFFSTTQFAVLAMGPLWRRATGTPYVIDIQDPWRTNYYFQKGARRPPGGWKYRLAHAQAVCGEPWVYRRAAGFISVSGRYLEELGKTYPWFKAKASATIPFGTSRTDLEAALAREETRPAAVPGTVRLVYTGATGPIMPDALNCLFAGLEHLLAHHPAAAARLRLEFLGTSYAAPDQARPSVIPLVHSPALRPLLHEEPRRLGHLECLRIQARADVLLLLGSTDLAYSPSKIYPYFMSGRPMLSLAFRGSVLEELLDRLGCGTVVRLVRGAPPEQTAGKIAHLLARVADSPDCLESRPRNEAFFQEHFMAPSLTAAQCRLFETALHQGAAA